MARGDLNASQLGRGERGQSITDREIETAIIRVLTNKLGLTERVVQQIQELSGERGPQGKPMAAVRRSDIGALERLPELGSSDAAASPTAAEFNALRNDVRLLYEALALIVRKIGA